MFPVNTSSKQVEGGSQSIKFLLAPGLGVVLDMLQILAAVVVETRQGQVTGSLVG